MKKLNALLVGLFILASTITMAQPTSGFEYFQGKWNVVANGPNEEVKMVISFEKIQDQIISIITDSEGKELFKVNSTTINESKAKIMFVIPNQGEVDMVLTKKDDDHLTGAIMEGMATSVGERMK